MHLVPFQIWTHKKIQTVKILLTGKQHSDKHLNWINYKWQKKTELSIKNKILKRNWVDQQLKERNQWNKVQRWKQIVPGTTVKTSAARTRTISKRALSNTAEALLGSGMEYFCGALASECYLLLCHGWAWPIPRRQRCWTSSAVLPDSCSAGGSWRSGLSWRPHPPSAGPRSRCCTAPTHRRTHS